MLTRFAMGEDISLSDSKDILNLMPIELTRVFEFKIPPRPTSHVLDTASFLTPELLHSLEDTLSKESREHGVDIYLLTVPSVQKKALEPFTQQVAETWMKGLFGATIVFDDGTGQVAIQQSEVVTKRFYEFELTALVRDTMSTTKRPRLSREGLEHTTLSMKTALHELKSRANREDRNSLLTRVGLTIVTLVSVLLGAFEYYRVRKPSSGDNSRNVTSIS